MDLENILSSLFIVILIGYALGCFSTGYYLVRFRTGENIRVLNSGSTGARNVGRVLGAPEFIITMLGDILKGAIAIWVAIRFGLEEWGVVLAIIAVVTGHIWPVQLGFQGGKGLATALGAVLVFDYRLAVSVLVFAILLLALTRRVTVSGLVALAAMPVIAAVSRHPPANLLGITILVLLILFAHRPNIRGILKNNTQ